MNNTAQTLQYLAEHIRHGTMNLHLSDGSHAVVGQGPPVVDWIIHSGATLEHIVRDPQYGHRPFFKHLTDLLRPDGLALIHAVGHNRPNCRDEWIPHHSDVQFPYPTLGTVLQKMDNLNIAVSDIEISHRHYALTFAAWQQRLNKYHSEIAARCGERFYRQWEFYLALCEALFRCRGLAVFEIQLAKNPNSLPLTRDYLCHNKEERRDRIVVQPVNGTLRIHVKK